MKWKKEILSNLICLFAVGFVLIPVIGYYTGMDGYLITALAFSSLFIAVILVIYVKKKGLQTESAKSREATVEEFSLKYLTPIVYVSCIFFVIMGILGFMRTGRVDILASVTISALIIFFMVWIAKRKSLEPK